MIKRILLYAIALMIMGVPAGQSQSLVTGTTDFIGLSGNPTSPHLVEAGPASFYWISGSNYSTVTHPKLPQVYNDFANLFFLKYDKNGNVLGSNYIRGSSFVCEAVSSNGGLTMMARANNDVDASGTPLTLNGAFNMEFIAKYDPTGKFEKIANVWNLGASQSMYSLAKGDKRDGSMYIFGTGNGPTDVMNYGIIGEVQSRDYLYVLKYSPDLQLEWVYTAGFDTTVSVNGYYNNLKVSPDKDGNVVITGSYEANSSPVFGGKVLMSHADGFGTFAVKLDRSGNQVWVLEGSMNGYGYATQIFKGLPMKNGDLVMAGATTTGYFQLGGVEVNFVNGSGFTNQFVFRIGPDGTIRWVRSLQNMGVNLQEGKKGTGESHGSKDVRSDEFVEEIFYDAIEWNNKILYMCGSFQNDAFNIAGRVLEKPYSTGAFIAAIDLANGDELWGYGLSSDYVYLQGFDADGGGNVSLMGASSENQSFEGLTPDSIFGMYPVFIVGLDYNGKPLWTNGVSIQQVAGYWLNGVDLEVLRNGQIFSSMYLAQAANLSIGGRALFENYPYTSWLVELVADSEIGGVVTDPLGNPVYPGYVKAFKSSPSGAYPMVDSVLLDDSGGFLFTGLNPGNYTLQVVPDKGIYPMAVPTYLGNMIDWSVAQFNDFSVATKANFLNINVSEVAILTPEDGSGTMSGAVYYEEDGGALKSTLAIPVKRASILVKKRPPQKKSTNEDEIVAFVETDDFGNFIFENIPDGDYLLVIDIAGLEMIETHEVNITGNQIKSGLDYTVGSDGIYTWTGVGISPEEGTQFRMFPNPGNGIFFMELPSQGNYEVRVFGTDGRLVASRRYAGANGFRTLDISDQNDGVYVIKLQGPNLSATVKYVKR